MSPTPCGPGFIRNQYGPRGNVRKMKLAQHVPIRRAKGHKSARVGHDSEPTCKFLGAKNEDFKQKADFGQLRLSWVDRLRVCGFRHAGWRAERGRIESVSFRHGSVNAKRRLGEGAELKEAREGCVALRPVFLRRTCHGIGRTWRRRIAWV